MISRRKPGALLPLVAALMVTAAPAREHGRERPPASVVAIVIHAVGGPACFGGAVHFHPIQQRDDDAAFWRKVLIGAPQNDVHFVIGRSGTRLPVIPMTEIANHTVGVNDVSIGIELVNRGDGQDPFPEAQISSLIELIREIRSQHPAISVGNIVAHSDIDQRTCACGGVAYRRRQDPGAAFPMAKVIEAVQRPDEAATDPPLRRLTGHAPRSACPVEPSASLR
jgi:N-acetylmuramoyl-L-alanine amidase